MSADLDSLATLKFAVSMRDKCATAAIPNGLGNFEACQFICLIETPDKWRLLCIQERHLDAAILKACGSSDKTSFPWAHASNWLAFLAQKALLSASPAPIPSTIFETFRTAASKNSYPNSRRGNNSCEIGLGSGAAQDATARLMSAFPTAWEFSSKGLPPMSHSKKTPSNPLDSFSLASLTQDPTPETPLFPLMQVDGDGHAHWIWLPACARALGAPPLLTSSREGLGLLLGLGDIYSTANKTASDAPSVFRSKFAKALAPASALDPQQIAPSSISRAFREQDLLSEEASQLEQASAPPSAPSAPQRRI